MAKRTPALALAVWLASLGALHAQERVKPLGKWERKIGKNQVALVVEDNRLHLTVVGEKPCTLHADYCMTKDQIIYGVVTSVECEEEDGHSVEKEMLDAPFSCRFRADEGALIVRDLKTAGCDHKDDLWVGRFKAVTPPSIPIGAVPPPPVASPDPPVPNTGSCPWQKSDNSSPSLRSSTPGDRNFLEEYYERCIAPAPPAPGASSIWLMAPAPRNESPILQNFWIGYSR